MSNFFYYKTPAGNIKVSTNNNAIQEAIFVDEKNVTESSKNINLKNFNLVGTEFQIKVWQAALKIPSGKTVTYQDIANQIGHSKAHRAVANALAQNKIAYFVPCHRVIRKDGKLGGYKWGIERKIKLLDFEKTM